MNLLVFFLFTNILANSIVDGGSIGNQIKNAFDKLTNQINKNINNIIGSTNDFIIKAGNSLSKQNKTLNQVIQTGNLINFYHFLNLKICY